MYFYKITTTPRKTGCICWAMSSNYIFFTVTITCVQEFRVKTKSMFVHVRSPVFFSDRIGLWLVYSISANFSRSAFHTRSLTEVHKVLLYLLFFGRRCNGNITLQLQSLLPWGQVSRKASEKQSCNSNCCDWEHKDINRRVSKGRRWVMLRFWNFWKFIKHVKSKLKTCQRWISLSPRGFWPQEKLL